MTDRPRDLGASGRIFDGLTRHYASARDLEEADDVAQLAIEQDVRHDLGELPSYDRQDVAEAMAASLIAARVRGKYGGLQGTLPLAAAIVDELKANGLRITPEPEGPVELYDQDDRVGVAGWLYGEPVVLDLSPTSNLGAAIRRDGVEGIKIDEPGFVPYRPPADDVLLRNDIQIIPEEWLSLTVRRPEPTTEPNNEETP